MANIIKKNFTIISNNIINCKDLSYGAKGVACYLLSKDNIEDWNYRLDDIKNHSNESLYAIKKYIKELEEIGFLKRERTTKVINGKNVFNWIYDFNEDFILNKNCIISNSNDANSIDTNSINTNSSDIYIQNNNNTEYNNTDNINNCTTNFSDKDLQNNKETKIDKNEEFLELATKLKDYIETTYNKKIDKKTLSNYANTIRLLHNSIKDREDPKKDIEKAINYLINDNNKLGKYALVIESATSFREKFSRIEDKIKRNNCFDFLNPTKNSKINYREAEKHIL